MTESNIVLMPLNRITIDLSISARASLPSAVIEEYTEALRRGEELPPVVGFRSGETTWISDGFLRHASYLAAGRANMPVECRVGGWREAKMHAASANSRHGLPRTSACKRLAILVVLDDEEGKTWTQQKVADHCNVSVPLVKAVQALAKTAATPAEVVAAKVEWPEGGRDMPQTPAEVYRPDHPTTPAPRHTTGPTPRPAAPTNRRPFITLDGVLDAPKEAEYVSDRKDTHDEDDGPEEDDEAAEDAEKTRERLLRSARKTERFANKLGLSLEEAVSWYRSWQAAHPWHGDKHGRGSDHLPPPTPPV